MGSAVSSDPRTTPVIVDLAKFAHAWTEVARLPVRFQPENTYGQAVYLFNAATNSMHITNTSIDAVSGLPIGRTVSGIAKPTQYNAQLSVKFYLLLPASKYHIYYINSAYTTTAVGSPDTSTLWIMVKDRNNIDRAEMADLLAHLAAIGFDTLKLVYWFQKK